MAALFQGYQSLIENSPDAISLINEEGEILYGSSSNTKLFGYTPDELVGRPCLEMIHPEDRDRADSALRETIVEPRGTRRWDARIRRKDGNYRWVESTASNLLLDLEVQAIVMHQRDINERWEAQERSRRQADELTRSKLRMEEFAYTVAHDLREPLRAIALYTEILFTTRGLDDATKQMAEFVIEGTRRMSTMISDLLSFASTGVQAAPTILNLADPVAQALQNLAREIEESGALVTVNSLPAIRGDQNQLTRLFQNLLSNAIKYRSEDPLTIDISAEKRGSRAVPGSSGARNAEPPRSALAAFTEEERGPDWAITIKDNGIGVALLSQSRIFLPFVRLTHGDVPGTGLGLAVCKKIVEGFGGTIGVESEPGIGSAFSFTILGEADSGQTELGGSRPH